MAMKEAGMVIAIISVMPMPLPPNNASDKIAAVAADTGEPVHPSDAAIVATLNGRSGRTLFLRAISEMIGRSA